MPYIFIFAIFFQAIAASAIAFIGLGFGILLISVLAVVILWFYGSFWTTSYVAFLGGHILQLTHILFGVKFIQILQFVNAVLLITKL